MINVTYEVTALSAFDYRPSLFLCSAASNHEAKCRSQHFSCILVIREMFPKVVCNSFQFYIYRGSACKLQCIAFGYFGPVVWPQFFYLINFFLQKTWPCSESFPFPDVKLRYFTKKLSLMIAGIFHWHGYTSTSTNTGQNLVFLLVTARKGLGWNKNKHARVFIFVFGDDFVGEIQSCLQNTLTTALKAPPA